MVEPSANAWAQKPPAVSAAPIPASTAATANKKPSSTSVAAAKPKSGSAAASATQQQRPVVPAMPVTPAASNTSAAASSSTTPVTAKSTSAASTSAITFGTAGAQTPSPQKPMPAVVATGMSYASAASSTASLAAASTKKLPSGAVPREVQQKIVNKTTSGGAGSSSSASSSSSATGTATPIQFGAGLEAPSPQKPMPTVNGVATASSDAKARALPTSTAQRFDDIQRVRSAPPQMDEQGKLKAHLHLQQQRANAVVAGGVPTTATPAVTNNARVAPVQGKPATPATVSASVPAAAPATAPATATATSRQQPQQQQQQKPMFAAPTQPQQQGAPPQQQQKAPATPGAPTAPVHGNFGPGGAPQGMPVLTPQQQQQLQQLQQHAHNALYFYQQQLMGQGYPPHQIAALMSAYAQQQNQQMYATVLGVGYGYSAQHPAGQFYNPAAGPANAGQAAQAGQVPSRRPSYNGPSPAAAAFTPGANAVNATPAAATTVPAAIVPPTPAAVPSPAVKAFNPATAKPFVLPARSAIKIVIKNPDTLEEVNLPEKTEKKVPAPPPASTKEEEKKVETKDSAKDGARADAKPVAEKSTPAVTASPAKPTLAEVAKASAASPVKPVEKQASAVATPTTSPAKPTLAEVAKASAASPVKPAEKQASAVAAPTTSPAKPTLAEVAKANAASPVKPASPAKPAVAAAVSTTPVAVVSPAKPAAVTTPVAPVTAVSPAKPVDATPSAVPSAPAKSAAAPATTDAVKAPRASSKSPTRADTKPVAVPAATQAAVPVATATTVVPPKPATLVVPAAAPVSTAIPKIIRYSMDFMLLFREGNTKMPADMPLLEVVAGQAAGAGGLPAGPSSQQGQPQRRRSAKERTSDVGHPPRGGAERGPDRGMDRSSGDRDRGGDRRYTDYGPGMRGGPPPSGRPPRDGPRGDGPRGPPPSGHGGRGGRPSDGPRRASGRGSRHSEPQHREPEVVLEVSENRWVPGSIARTKEALDATEAMARQVRGWLNKLTLEKFDSISTKMLAIPVLDMEMLRVFVELIFDKAVEEARFADMYARLCMKMSNELPNFEPAVLDELVKTLGGDAEKQSMRNHFRRAILSSCQKEYEKKSDWSTLGDDSAKRMTDDMTTEELEEYTARENERRKMKRRALCNIRFIGALYNLNMISEKIIHQCITHLVRDAIMANPEEEEVESVCDLVSSIGGKLDQTTTNKTMVNAYFDRMKTLSVNKALVSRIRFKLIDILELRSRNWVAREGQQYLHGGPMTIEEIHRVEEEKQRAARRKTMATTRDRDIGRGSSRRMDDRDRDRRQTRGGAPMGGRPDRERMSGGPHEEFTTVRNPVLMARRAEREAERAALKAAASTAAAPPPARDLLPSKSSNASKDELPTSTSRSSVAAPPASKKSEGRPNAFDVLAQSDEDEHEEGEIVDDEHSASGEIEEDDELTSPTDGADRKKDIKTADELDKYVQRNLANDFMVACEYGVPECVDVLLKLRSFVQDEKMEDITQTALAKLVEELSKDARKIKGGLGTESAESVTARRKVECLGNVAVWFCRQQLLSTERFTEYLKENISILTELVLDCPGVDTCLAVVSGACLVDGLLSMSFLRQCIVELADVAGDFTPRVMRKPGFPFKLMPPAPASFIATVLETVRSMDERGEEAVREAWAGYVVEEEGRDSREDLTAVLEQTDMSMIKFPWWGTDKAKLAAIDDEDVCAWLKSRSLLALVAPLRELTHELNTLLKPECNATTANVPIETVKSYLASHSESRKNDPRFVAAVAEVCLRHAHKVATPEPEAGTDAAPPTSNFAVEKKSLEKWLVALVKPLIVAPEERALTTRLQLEVLFTVQHLCSGGAKPPSSATFKCDDTYCRRVFELLYELEVVDEESFLAWEREETRMRDTKEVMMVRGARDFLEWLRTADE